MRLIDADDLKKKLQYVYSCDYIDSTSKEGIASDIIDGIDNAQTVPLPDFKEGYKQAIRDGKTNFSRPQGKWIDNHQDVHFCKSCGYFALYQTKDSKNYFEKLSNFCPNCGADMKEVDNDK